MILGFTWLDYLGINFKSHYIVHFITLMIVIINVTKSEK